MAIFDISMAKALQAEGAHSNDLQDLGSATSYGISLRWLASQKKVTGYIDSDVNGNGIIDVSNLREMKREAGAALYKSGWWDRYFYGLLSQPVADKALIAAINIGAPNVNSLLQQACRAHGVQIGSYGVLDSKMLDAIRKVSARDGEGTLLATFRAEEAAYYRWIVAKNARLAKYQDMWVGRAYA